MCPGGARISTKPEKSMPEKSGKNEERKKWNLEGIGGMRGADGEDDRRGEEAEKARQKVKGKRLKAKGWAADLGRNWSMGSRTPTR